MKRSNVILFLAGTAAAAALSLGAYAGEQCYTAEVPHQTTNWKVDMPLPQFDPALGTLTGVVIKVEASIEGDIRYESLDEAASIAMAKLGADLTLCEPGSIPILTLMLGETRTDNLSAYDGLPDFGGTSGRTYTSLMAEDSEVYVPADLAMYIGTGDLLFATKAEATSKVEGPGNIVQQLATHAQAKVTICYRYDEAGDEGCTPGYWKNHPRSWPPTGYAPGNKFDDVFGVSAFGKMTLLEVVDQGGGQIKALGRHAVAALLNAAHPGVESPYSVGEVIAAVQYAVGSGDYERVKNHLEDANELGCPLSGPAK